MPADSKSEPLNSCTAARLVMWRQVRQYLSSAIVLTHVAGDRHHRLVSHGHHVGQHLRTACVVLQAHLQCELGALLGGLLLVLLALREDLLDEIVRRSSMAGRRRGLMSVCRRG